MATFHLIVYRFSQVLLMQHRIELSLGTFQWFHTIEDNLVLGAIPLDNLSHPKVFSEELGVTAVLSVVELFELTANNIAGNVVGPDDWKRVDVQHHHVSTPDFMTVSFEKLDEGADFIHDHLRSRRGAAGAPSSSGKVGGVVYVHCKSGMGRSAQVVVAYLMKVNMLT